MDISDCMNLCRANGFDSVTDAVTAARLAKGKIEKLEKALKETTAETREIRKNILECQAADPLYFSRLPYRQAWSKELARLNEMIERADAALSHQ